MDLELVLLIYCSEKLYDLLGAKSIFHTSDPKRSHKDQQLVFKKGRDKIVLVLILPLKRIAIPLVDSLFKARGLR